MNKYLLYGLLLFLPFTCKAQQDTVKVLFVGNSYTFFWNMPKAFQLMGTSQNIPIYARQSTSSGTTWSDHWHGRKGLDTRALIQSEKWDYVILQNHSKSTYDRRDSFMVYGKKLIQLVRQQGAEPVLYSTWTREDEPKQLAVISAVYQDLGREAGVRVAPVGYLFSAVLQADSSIQLYHSDHRHPSPTGSYLAALVIYRTLIGPVADIPERLLTVDENGDKLYIAIVEEDLANRLKRVVDEYVLPEAIQKLHEQE